MRSVARLYIAASFRQEDFTTLESLVPMRQTAPILKKLRTNIKLVLLTCFEQNSNNVLHDRAYLEQRKTPNMLEIIGGKDSTNTISSWELEEVPFGEDPDKIMDLRQQAYSTFFEKANFFSYSLTLFPHRVRFAIDLTWFNQNLRKLLGENAPNIETGKTNIRRFQGTKGIHG